MIKLQRKNKEAIITTILIVIILLTTGTVIRCILGNNPRVNKTRYIRAIWRIESKIKVDDKYLLNYDNLRKTVFNDEEVNKVAEDKSEISTNEGKWIFVICTAYTSDGKECGKKVGDGITASGRKASTSRGSISAPHNVPFYSKVYIPDLHKTYVVEDRGNKKYIKWINKDTMRIDIYFDSKKDAIKFGVKKFKAQIIYNK